METKKIENEIEETSNETKKEKTIKEETKKIENEIEETSNEAKKEKTIKVNIPIDQLNPKDKEIVVGINEKYARIVRGEETKVSEAVYEQLKNAGLV